MSDSFGVGRTEGDLDDETRHAMVAAQLRGEQKAPGRSPEAVIESVAEELRGMGVEPDHDELQRRYAAIDPDLPLVDRDDESGASLPADAPRADGQSDEDERQRRVPGGDHHQHDPPDLV